MAEANGKDRQRFSPGSTLAHGVTVLARQLTGGESSPIPQELRQSPDARGRRRRCRGEGGGDAIAVAEPRVGHADEPLSGQRRRPAPLLLLLGCRRLRVGWMRNLHRAGVGRHEHGPVGGLDFSRPHSLRVPTSVSSNTWRRIRHLGLLHLHPNAV